MGHPLCAERWERKRQRTSGVFTENESTGFLVREKRVEAGQ